MRLGYVMYVPKLFSQQNCTTCVCVFIRIGEKVPFSKKGRYGVVHGSVRDQFFRPSHCDIETSTSDDISLESINKLVSLQSWGFQSLPV